MKAPASLDDEILFLTPTDILRTPYRVNPRIAVDPDNTTVCIFWECTDLLRHIFTNIFNTSLNQAITPVCFKLIAIVALLTKSPASTFNDYSLIERTSIMMKCFERLVTDQITSTSLQDLIHFSLHIYLTAPPVIPYRQHFTLYPDPSGE